MVWYSLKDNMKLPSPSPRTDIGNFTNKILYHIYSSIIRFDIFREIYTQETSQWSEFTVLESRNK